MTPLLTRLLGRDAWYRHHELISTLGLLPLLAASASLQHALLIAGLTLTVTLATALIALPLRAQFPVSLRWAMLALLIGALTLCGELFMQAWIHARYAGLEFFIPCVMANSLLLTPVLLKAMDATAPRALQRSGLDVVAIMLAMLLTGLLHDLLGSTLGTAVVLLLLATLLAVKNTVLPPPPVPGSSHEAPVVAGSKRVRITGKL